MHRVGSSSERSRPLSQFRKSLCDLGPALRTVIPGMANDLVKHCAFIFDDNCFDAGPADIESDRCLRPAR
jgi:hypothetical protein